MITLRIVENHIAKENEEGGTDRKKFWIELLKSLIEYREIGKVETEKEIDFFRNIYAQTIFNKEIRQPARGVLGELLEDELENLKAIKRYKEIIEVAKSL